MKKKLVVALMTAALGMGCMTMTAMAEDTTIRMWTFLDPTNTENGRSVALSQMIDEFEAENEGVKVVVEPQDWNTMTAKFWQRRHPEMHRILFGVREMNFAVC